MKRILFIAVTTIVLELILFSPMLCKVFFGFGFMFNNFMTVCAVALATFGTVIITEYYYDQSRQLESDKRFITRELKRLSKKYPELIYSYYLDRWDMHVIIFQDPLLCDGLMENLQNKLNGKLYGEAVVTEDYPEFNRPYYQLIYES